MAAYGLAVHNPFPTALYMALGAISAQSIFRLQQKSWWGEGSLLPQDFLLKAPFLWPLKKRGRRKAIKPIFHYVFLKRCRQVEGCRDRKKGKGNWLLDSVCITHMSMQIGWSGCSALRLPANTEQQQSSLYLRWSDECVFADISHLPLDYNELVP